MRAVIDRHPFLFISLIAVVSMAMHWHVFSLDVIGVHNMRQAQTQQNIQNFYREDFNILNPRINVMSHTSEAPVFRYEFPVMQWAVAAVFKLTGESILVTRIMMFLIGLGSVTGMFFLLKYIFDDTVVAWAGAWAFNFSPAFYYYSTCPMPDNLALCGAICSLAFFFRFLKTSAHRDVFFSAFFLSLGVAAKLPFILFAAAPAYYLIKTFFKKSSEAIQLAAIYFAFILPTFAWYAWVIPTWNNGVIQGIFDHQISWERAWDILNFHMVRTFPERLTNWGAVPLLLAGIYYSTKNKVWQNGKFGILAAAGLACLVYWIYEFNMIEKVHDYYMLPFLPFIFIFVAYGVKGLLLEKHKVKWLFLALLFTLQSFAFNYTKRDWSLKKSGYNHDVFLYQDDLRAASPSGAKCIIVKDPTLYVFSYLIDRRAFVFVNENMPGSWVEDLIKNYGVTYLYSNSRKVDEDPEVAAYFEKMVMKRGNIRVFKLKEY